MILRFLLLLIVAGSAWAAPLPVKQELLGPWTYLYPLDVISGAGAPHWRSVSTPTTLPFGATRERIAVILPASTKLAEFKDGVFEDLQLPDEWTPYSLAVDRDGKLYCLVQHAEKFLSVSNEWKKRWAIGLGAGGWEAPVFIPWEGCDRLEFDSQDRLWALGTNPHVGFFADGKWTTYTYSDDRKLQFLPLRLSEDPTGRVVLFPYEQPPGWPGEYSRMTGNLIYERGRFTRAPHANTSALCAAENRRYAEPLDQPGFDRAHGYVCHTPALNAQYRGPVTALRAGEYFLVALGCEGFLWAKMSDLAVAPPLKSDEWELLDDITALPTLDAAGNLWVGRGHQFLEISATKEEVAAGQLTAPGDSTVDIDSLGRPWVMRWHGSLEGTVTICDHGVLRTYSSFDAALQSERDAFAPGRIFAFALKSPAGLVAEGGGYSDAVTIIDAKGSHRFTPRQISPTYEPPHSGHGYNPFRGGEPSTDAAGTIYTRLDGLLYAYHSAHRTWSPVPAEQEPPSTLPPLPKEHSDYAGPFGAKLELAGGREIIFKGFHFFARTEAGEQQLDTGVNPLAFYPFWSSWYRSPGLTKPILDPMGRLWITALGPYAGNREWLRLRKPLP